METVWPGTAKQPGWPFSSPGQTCGPSQHLPPNSPCTTEVPQDMHTSTQWTHGPPFLRVTPGKCQLKEFTNTSTRPCCQGKFSWTFTLTPFLYAILIFLHRTSSSKSPWHNSSWSSIMRGRWSWVWRQFVPRSMHHSSSQRVHLARLPWTALQSSGRCPERSAQCPWQDGHQRLG